MRKLGPAFKHLSMKANARRGECAMRRCTNKCNSPKGKWCEKHKLVVRTLQLAMNNIVWRKRVALGKADHHVVYKGRPTRWSLAHKGQALEKVREGASVVPSISTMKRLLAEERRSAQ